MSTNEPARLQSRRAFLSTSAAVAAIGGPTVSPALASTPDPVFQLVATERSAWDAFNRAAITLDDAEQALIASEWDRQPRVLVGEYTAMVRGPNFDSIPREEQRPEPVYVHDHDAIDRDCDRHAKEPGAVPAEVVERRARLHRALNEDIAAIAAAPEVARESEAQQAYALVFERWQDAAQQLTRATPTSTAGLVAMIERFETYAKGCMVDYKGDGLDRLLATARTFLSTGA